MSIKKVTTVDFSDIFDFAKEKFNIEWNAANDLFFRTGLINYPGQTNLYLGDIKANFKSPSDWAIKKGYVKAYEILIAFMEENDLKEMMVLGD